MKISPETNPIITGLAPCAASATGDTADAICLKNAKGVLILVMHGGTSDNDVTLTVHEGATAAEAQAGTYAIAATLPIWVDAAVATTDALTRQSDAASYTIDSNAGDSYLVAIYVDAAILTNGRDWISLGHDAGHASNFLAVLYIIDGERYQQASPLTAIA